MLSLVPTPLGNLGDITHRALETLSSVDFIAAEDTRVTLKLLHYFSIKKPLLPYHRHNEERGGEEILSRLLSGESCALVSDAGSPAISDPGEDLVRRCIEAGIPVTALPGPCALTTAISISGIATGRFTFEGFLAMNKKNRKSHLASLEKEERTMIFYEAPHKLPQTLLDFQQTFGDQRQISLCRELTKIHEEVLRMTIGEAISYYETVRPRGEFVLVLAGCPQEEEDFDPMPLALEELRQALAEGKSFSASVKEIAKETGVAKNLLYQEGKFLIE
ncbi:MAG: 16S rRNA (cytidine(1402)-2'-O)-methyltransferase [Eubacteriales bacterium]